MNKIIEIVVILFIVFLLTKLLTKSTRTKQEKLALEKFKEVTGIIPEFSSFEDLGKNTFIVTIEHGNSKPRKRTFWQVELENEKVFELSYEEAGQLIKILPRM